MKTFSRKDIAVIGIGAGLFFVLGRFVAIPSPVPTVNICVQYGLLGFLAALFGPMVGMLTGLIGHILIDMSSGAFCWSWIAASAAFGGLVGGLANITRIDPADPGQQSIIKFNLIQVAVHVVCWAGIAPVLEILIYSESIDRIFEQGLTAAIINAVTTAIVGSLLLNACSAVKTRRSRPKD